MRKPIQGKRFAALLLFQFRVMVDGSPGKRRLCEKRIINFKAKDGTVALKEAKRYARVAQYSYMNSDGNRVHFEFIGVQDLICLEICEADEVWYDIVKLVRPMERKKLLIPPEKDLDAIRNKDQKSENILNCQQRVTLQGRPNTISCLDREENKNE